MKKLLLPLFALVLLAAPKLSYAGNAVDTVAVQGYDLVSYHQSNGVPVKGVGNHVVYHDGVGYLFANDSNKKTFTENPEKYLPAYGGYCAFGVTKGKKFEGDPMAYKLVSGKVYLNLSKDVQKIWLEDVPGNIQIADKQWPSIKNIHPSEL